MAIYTEKNKSRLSDAYYDNLSRAFSIIRDFFGQVKFQTLFLFYSRSNLGRFIQTKKSRPKLGYRFKVLMKRNFVQHFVECTGK